MITNDHYELSDSEDDYTEGEKQLLRKVRNRNNEFSDSEDEIFGVGSDDSDDENKNTSDIEDRGDNNELPDVRAWGKDKRKYYFTDYVDPDYGSFQGKDAQLAQLEEDEAKNLQRQLIQQLDDDDFSLDIFSKKPEDNKLVEEFVKTDISKLSDRQKLQILQKDSPEFFGLIEDFNTKMSIIKDSLYPVLQKYKKKEISSCKTIEFIQTKYELILNYCTNILMYLYLKSARINVQNHPVIKRLYQYRQLISQLTPLYEEIIKPQIDMILQEMDSNGVEKENNDKKKTLKLLTTLTKKLEQNAKRKTEITVSEEKQAVKKSKVEQSTKEDVTKKSETKMGVDENVQADPSLNEDYEEEQIDASREEEQDDHTKRAITYQMAKNKGLTPHRKKEQRNPRVKHRLKFRKVLIRRKGAVREPRREVTRYSGEVSGIKAYTSKSIKIKT